MVAVLLRPYVREVHFVGGRFVTINVITVGSVLVVFGWTFPEELDVVEFDRDTKTNPKTRQIGQVVVYIALPIVRVDCDDSVVVYVIVDLILAVVPEIINEDQFGSLFLLVESDRRLFLVVELVVTAHIFPALLKAWLSISVIIVDRTPPKVRLEAIRVVYVFLPVDFVRCHVKLLFVEYKIDFIRTNRY